MANYTSTRGILLNQNLSDTLLINTIQAIDTAQVITETGNSIINFIKNNQSSPYNWGVE